jgi:hypothetical protein
MGTTASIRHWNGTENPEEAAMSNKTPLRPDDFPVHVEGDTVKKHDGKSLAKTDDPAVAADVAERLNEDEGRREEDKWSA